LPFGRAGKLLVEVVKGNPRRRTAIKNINELNGDIALASKEQSEVAKSINENVNDVSIISNESVTLSTETEHSSDELAQVAMNLRAAVSKFEQA
jgi:methyl-accepting chemotaxis protein